MLARRRKCVAVCRCGVDGSLRLDSPSVPVGARDHGAVGVRAVTMWLVSANTESPVHELSAEVSCLCLQFASYCLSYCSLNLSS